MKENPSDNFITIVVYPPKKIPWAFKFDLISFKKIILTLFLLVFSLLLAVFYFFPKVTHPKVTPPAPSAFLPESLQKENEILMQKLNAKTAPTPEIPWIKIPADFKNNTSEKILKVEDFNYNESNSQITFNIINNHTKSMAGFIWVLLKNKNTLSFFPTQHNDFLISSYQQGLPFSMQKLRPVVAFFTDIHMPHPLARILIFSKTGDLILDETKEF